jgi:serine/threonine protein kinase
MHRDVKPHNVMIDHENKKAGSLIQILYAEANGRSYDLLIGVLRSSIIKAPSTMYEWHRDTSRALSYL